MTTAMNLQEHNKSLVRRLYDETNKADIAILDELFSEELVNHQAGVTDISRDVSPLQNLRNVFEMFYKGFPDTLHIIEELIAEGDKVVARISATGTHDTQQRVKPM